MTRLHTRPIKGFNDFVLYYVVPIGAERDAPGAPSSTIYPDRLTILRVLHIKRDIESNL